MDRQLGLPARIAVDARRSMGLRGLACQRDENRRRYRERARLLTRRAASFARHDLLLGLLFGGSGYYFTMARW
jgi:hypothetical protein